MLEADKLGKHKDLSDFDKGQIVTARRLGPSSKCEASLGVLGLQWSVPAEGGLIEGQAVNGRAWGAKGSLGLLIPQRGYCSTKC